MAGKGDTFRPVDQKRYAANYDEIFKKKEAKDESDVQMEKKELGGNDSDAGQMRDLRITPPVAGERKDSDRLVQE